MTITEMSASDVVRGLYEDIEAGCSGDQLRRHFTQDAITVVHPNAITPGGSTSDLATMLAASVEGARLLAEQRYDVDDVRLVEGLAIARLRWTGVVAHDAGPFRAGQRLTAHIAQFVRLEDDRIARIETYDCYEPISPPS